MLIENYTLITHFRIETKFKLRLPPRYKKFLLINFLSLFCFLHLLGFRVDGDGDLMSVVMLIEENFSSEIWSKTLKRSRKSHKTFPSEITATLERNWSATLRTRTPLHSVSFNQFSAIKDIPSIPTRNSSNWFCSSFNGDAI